MKKIIVILIIVIAIAFGIYWVNNQLKKVDLQPYDMKVSKLTKNEIKGSITIELINPFFDVKVSDLNLAVSLNGIELTHLKEEKPGIRIEGDKVYITSSFNVNLKEFSLNNIVAFLESKSKNYRVTGTVKVSKWGLGYLVPIDYSDKFQFK